MKKQIKEFDNRSNHFKNHFKVCQSCGKYFEKLFQQDLCSNCLQKKFQKLRPLIDSVRLEQNRTATVKAAKISQKIPKKIALK